jgi:probable rRNA maturation factor
LKIYFVSKLADFEINNEERYIEWIKKVIKNEGKSLGDIAYSFVSEKDIIDNNTKFLNHNYVTDILTFSNTFLGIVSGEIFICIQAVKENSVLHSDHNFYHELNRVIVHGVLHLIGYKDSTNAEILIMREKEDFYLQLF